MNGASLTITGTSGFAGNAVVGGSGGVVPQVSAANGSAYGPDLFVGGNVIMSPAPGQSLTVGNLGGAGNLADPNVAANPSDPNANGALFVTGGGLVTLTGTSYLSGPMTVNTGTLALAAGATEQGTSLVTVGQNAGDQATLAFGGGSQLTLGGWNFTTPTASTDQPVVIARDAGSTGRVVFGDGAGTSGAYVAARVFTGGSGTASVAFQQQYAAGSASDTVYPFFTTLTGSLGVVQDGPGTTSLQPLYGANTFSGAVTVDAGTLTTTGTRSGTTPPRTTCSRSRRAWRRAVSRRSPSIPMPARPSSARALSRARRSCPCRSPRRASWPSRPSPAAASSFAGCGGHR